MDTQNEIAKAAAFLATLPFVARFELIGSAMYLPDSAQDVDFAVLLKPGVALFYGEALLLDGGDFSRCSEYDTSGTDARWTSVRREHLNLMLTTDEAWLERYLAAMEVCKYLQVADKPTRIAICRIVREGHKADAIRGDDLAG